MDSLIPAQLYPKCAKKMASGEVPGVLNPEFFTARGNEKELKRHYQSHYQLARITPAVEMVTQTQNKVPSGASGAGDNDLRQQEFLPYSCTAV